MRRLTYSALTVFVIALSGCSEKLAEPGAGSPDTAKPAAASTESAKDVGGNETAARGEAKNEAAAPAEEKDPPPDVAKLDLLPVQVHFEEVIPTGFFDAARLGIDEEGIRVLSILLHHIQIKREDAPGAVERMRYITWAYVADRSHKQLKEVYKPILEAQAKGDAKEFSRLANAVNAWRLWRRSISDLMLNEKKPAEAPELKAMTDLLEQVRTAKDVASQKEPLTELQKQHSAYAKKIGRIKCSPLD